MIYILENNINKYRKKYDINISTILEYMGWANRSVLYKKENNLSKISIKEALLLSKLFKTSVDKIFTLKVSK